MSQYDDLDAADARLIQIVDSAYAEARRRAGDRLVCQAGCGDCCAGAIPINVLDARRLGRGIRRLRETDPELAGRILARAHDAVARFKERFPGDATTGVLGKDKEKKGAFFTRFAELPCPALNRQSGVCEVYEYRPVACRVAGPPVRFGEESLPHCALCFRGANEAEVEAAQVDVDPGNVELSLLAEHGLEQTLIAYALVRGASGD